MRKVAWLIDEQNFSCELLGIPGVRAKVQIDSLHRTPAFRGFVSWSKEPLELMTPPELTHNGTFADYRTWADGHVPVGVKVTYECWAEVQQELVDRLQAYIDDVVDILQYNDL